MEAAYDSKPQRVTCFNTSCGETLFITGLMGPDTTLRGVDRYPLEGTDELGPYIECPKCGAKHQVLRITVPGRGIQERICGLRK